MLKNLLLLGGKNWWLSFLLWILIIGPAQAAVEMRVAIKKNIQQLQVGSSTSAMVLDGAGRKLGEINGMEAFSAKNSGRGVTLSRWQSPEIIIQPKDDGYVWIGDRWYRGKTRLVRSNGNLFAVNHLDLEDYLYSVVGAEAIPSWPLEALKAQAVAARTYALHERSKANNKLYDVDTTTATQVYKGLDSEYSSTVEAVSQTIGQVMTYKGTLILAVFHSSSGGHTENVEDVWSQHLAYLRGVVDYDQDSPVYQWNATFSRSELSRRLTGVGNITAMIPQQTTPLGRVVTMKVVGDRGSKIFTGTQIRQALDLRSTLFRVANNSGNFQVNGRGFGHGLGLSQWGAHNLAANGLNYLQILGHYYQNASLNRI